MKKLVFISVFLIFASPVWATVYKWTDERGVVNFADDPDKIPASYRNSAEEINTPKMPTRTAQAATTSMYVLPIHEPKRGVKLGDTFG